MGDEESDKTADMEAVVDSGESPSLMMPLLIGEARRLVAALLEFGILQSDSPRATLRLAFPAALASRWMPGLFPEMVG